jgi:hypothetical protein
VRLSDPLLALSRVQLVVSGRCRSTLAEGFEKLHKAMENLCITVARGGDLALRPRAAQVIDQQ